MFLAKEIHWVVSVAVVGTGQSDPKDCLAQETVVLKEVEAWMIPGDLIPMRAATTLGDRVLVLGSNGGVLQLSAAGAEQLDFGDSGKIIALGFRDGRPAALTSEGTEILPVDIGGAGVPPRRILEWETTSIQIEAATWGNLGWFVLLLDSESGQRWVSVPWGPLGQDRRRMAFSPGPPVFRPHQILLAVGADRLFLSEIVAPLRTWTLRLGREELETLPRWALSGQPSDPAVLERFGRALWVASPVLEIEGGYVQAFSDVRSDLRAVQFLSPAFQTRETKFLNAPISFVATSPDHGKILAFRRINTFEAAWYEVVTVDGIGGAG